MSIKSNGMNRILVLTFTTARIKGSQAKCFVWHFKGVVDFLKLMFVIYIILCSYTILCIGTLFLKRLKYKCCFLTTKEVLVKKIN